MLLEFDDIVGARYCYVRKECLKTI